MLSIRFELCEFPWHAPVIIFQDGAAKLNVSMLRTDKPVFANELQRSYFLQRNITSQPRHHGPSEHGRPGLGWDFLLEGRMASTSWWAVSVPGTSSYVLACGETANEAVKSAAMELGNPGGDYTARKILAPVVLEDAGTEISLDSSGNEIEH